MTGINLRKLKEQSEKQVEAQQKKEVIPSTHSFHVKWIDPTTGKTKIINGVECDGMFTSKIPSIEERLKIGYIVAQLSKGVPFVNLDVLSQNIIMWLATTAVCLIDKPAWFDEVAGQEYLEPLQRVYEEITAHQDKFFRTESSGGELDAGNRPSVVITSGMGNDIQPAGDAGKSAMGK